MTMATEVVQCTCCYKQPNTYESVNQSEAKTMATVVDPGGEPD